MLIIYIALFIRIVTNPLANLFQKQLTARSVNAALVNRNTYLLLALGCIPFCFSVSWMSLPREFWINSLIVGILGGIGNSFLVKALQRGELSVLGPINSYKSVIGLIIAFFLLGEIPGWLGLVGMGLIAMGSYFVLDQAGARFSWRLLLRKDIQYRILAMGFGATEAVFIKKVIEFSSIHISFISWCLFGALVSVILVWFESKSSVNKNEFSMVRIQKYIFLVICIGLMQLATNYVLSSMNVGYALSLFQLSMLISIYLGYKFFMEKNIRRKIIGTLMMMAGSVVIILFDRG